MQWWHMIYYGSFAYNFFNWNHITHNIVIFYSIVQVLLHKKIILFLVVSIISHQFDDSRPLSAFLMKLMAEKLKLKCFFLSQTVFSIIIFITCKWEYNMQIFHHSLLVFSWSSLLISHEKKKSPEVASIWSK